VIFDRSEILHISASSNLNRYIGYLISCCKLGENKGKTGGGLVKKGKMDLVQEEWRKPK